MSFNVTVRSDFGSQENKICHCFLFPLLFAKKRGDRTPRQPFHSPRSPSSRDFSSFSLSSIRVVSSTYLRPLIFLLATLVPAWDSLQLAFHMLSSACKLVKQDCDKQPCHTPFPIWNQSVVDS